MENSSQEEDYSEEQDGSSYEADQCQICCEDIEIYGITPCNHNIVCGQCHYKMRVKENIQCTLCKVSPPPIDRF